MFEKLKDIYYNLIIGIPNLFKWFVTIFMDKPWNNYAIFLKKLELQSKHLKKNGYTMSAESKAKEIDKAIVILKKIIADEYFNNFLDAHEAKYGKLTEKFVPYEGVDSLFTIITLYEKEYTTAEKEQERKEYFTNGQLAEDEKQKDIEEVFTYIGKNIDNWID